MMKIQIAILTACTALLHLGALPADALVTQSAESSCLTPPPGLVSWWQGEGNAEDSLGVNSGTLQGGVVFAPGKVGQAFSFNGSTQYVRIPSSTSLSPTGSFTVDAWIYPTANNNGTIFSKWGDSGDYSGQRSYDLHLDAGNSLNFSLSDDAHQSDGSFHALSTPSNSIVLNSWNHVAGVYDQSTGTRRIYINGVLAASRADSPYTITAAKADVSIGAWMRSSSDVASFFQGLIDEVDFFSRALSAAEVQAIYNAGADGKCGIPIPPAHGGLSATVFRVNGNSAPAYPPAATPVQGLADTVLQFAAQQTGTPGGLSMRVQATTTPDVEGSWTDLPNTTNGLMTLDVTTNQFVVSSNEYPHEQADPVYFRAVASAQGYPDSISNVVGPFNLTSNKPRLSTRLDFTGNGTIADFYFRATESATVAGMPVHVQASTTPGEEASWSDLSNGNSGNMTQSTDAKQFLLLVNNSPATKGVYFRAIATASGYVKSISNVMGPYDITADIPPIVAVYTQPGLSGGGDGHDADHPIKLTPNTTLFTAGVQSERAIKTVKLQVDGMTVSEYPGTGDPNTRYPALFTAGIGDHIFQAVAIDDLGARTRAGTGATYVRVVPGQSSAKAERAAGSSATTVETAGHVFTAVQLGFWDNENTWNDENGKVNGVPGENDMAIIGKLNIGIQNNVRVKAVTTLSGARLSNGTGEIWALRVLGQMEIADLRISGPIQIIIDQDATCVLTNSSNIQFGQSGELFVAGTLQDLGSAGLVGANSITNQGRIHFVPPITIPANAAVDPAAALRILQANSVTGSGLIGGDVSALITNDGGTLITNDGGTLVASGGGNLVATGGGNLVATGGGNILSPNSANLVATGGGNLVATGGGNLVATGGGNFHATGQMKAATAASAPGFTQTGGESNLNAFTIVGPVTLNGGTLTGTGIIQGDLTNNGGYILPGGSSSAGRLAVTGNFIQGANGTTIIERAGRGAAQFDQVQIGGNASLGGKLDVKTINGYKPDAADTFNPLGYKTATGVFASISSNAQATVNSNGVLLSVDPTKANPTTGQPLNIATRMSVQMGDNVLIAGFIVSGPSGSTKKVLIRGMGPSLAQFGVAGTLSDPFLELHKPDGSVASNDNWQTGDTSQIPNGFAPSDPREAVIVATLTPGNYSAVVKGAHGETGVGIAELYDLDSASAAKLANISTRGFINTGDDVMIGGFIIGGNEPAKILVRAIGPTLTDFGVQGALADPTLELHDANGGTISNDDWRETQESEIIATTIPPNKDREPAILATLVPGNYTAIVRGKNNTTGIGLVEAYNLQ